MSDTVSNYEVLTDINTNITFFGLLEMHIW